jgi:hypothetical protein
MTVHERLQQLAAKMPEDRLKELLDFAEFLTLRDEQAEWRRFGLAQLARAYSGEEPEYTLADLKT